MRTVDETQVTEQERFCTERDAIAQAVEQIGAEIVHALEAIRATDAAKAAAKEAYARGLDLGDEKAMRAALAEIRRANEGRPAAVAALMGGELGNRILALRARHDSLQSVLGALRENASRASQAAKNAGAIAESFWGMHLDLLNNLNAVSDELTAARDTLSQGGAILASE